MAALLGIAGVLLVLGTGVGLMLYNDRRQSRS